MLRRVVITVVGAAVGALPGLFIAVTAGLEPDAAELTVGDLGVVLALAGAVVGAAAGVVVGGPGGVTRLRRATFRCFVYAVTCVPVIGIWWFDEPEPPINAWDYGLAAAIILVSVWAVLRAEDWARLYLSPPPRWPWWRPLATLYWQGRRAGDPETQQSQRVLRSVTGLIRITWVVVTIVTLARLVGGIVRS